MEIVIVEKKTFEALLSGVESLTGKVGALCRRCNDKQMQKWLDGQEVCRMKILCDTREQAPYTFDRYQGVTVERAALQTCDYSLAGLHDHIGLERKSLDDLTGTLTKGRERFQRECERGRGLDYFGLIIEASLEDVRNHVYRSQMTPQSLLQTLAAYSVRYGLHVHWCGGRAGGEYMAYSLLQKFLAEQEGRLKALIKAHGDAA